MFQVAHKWSNIKGGNRLVSVTEHKGKALVKVTEVPAAQHKEFNLGIKEFTKLVESSNEKYLCDAIRRMEA